MSDRNCTEDACALTQPLILPNVGGPKKRSLRDSSVIGDRSGDRGSPHRDVPGGGAAGVGKDKALAALRRGPLTLQRQDPAHETPTSPSLQVDSARARCAGSIPRPRSWAHDTACCTISNKLFDVMEPYD